MTDTTAQPPGTGGDMRSHVRRLHRRAKGPRLELRVGLPVLAVVAAAGAVAALRVPYKTPAPSPDERMEALVRSGPASYFHHVFDPDGLLGPVGHLDLELDTLERQTGHGVLLAAVPGRIENVPEFTMHAAEAWRPGTAGADDGIVVVLFPELRRVRVEVGYGLEPGLPDAEVRRLVSETMLPPARDGDLSAAVEALVPPLVQRLRTVPPAVAKPRARLSDVAVAAREIPRRARVAWSAWLAGPSGLRLLLTAAAAVLLAGLAVLLARIAFAALLLLRRVRASRDPAQLKAATAELVNALLRLGQVAVVLFVMVVGTSFFFAGTGAFGGAGVELPW